MAFDTFMYLEGGNPQVKGETQDKTYSAKNAFEIYSFSFGASNPTTIGSSSGGASAGKVSISSFNIMKKSDSASPTLFTNCCNGTHFDTATVVLRKAGGTSAVEYLSYTFKEVFVESIQWSGSSGGDDTPSESVSFAFGNVAIEYKPQVKSGAAGSSSITATWDLTKNVAAAG
jgi:type VI secretion system secreted protein Hcp